MTVRGQWWCNGCDLRADLEAEVKRLREALARAHDEITELSGGESADPPDVSTATRREGMP